MSVVEVYRNLHKKQYSIRDNKTRRVVDHAHYLRILNPKFVVQPGGRSRVLREKRKNVHAFIKGERNDGPFMMGTSDLWKKIKYNPYKYNSFVIEETEEPILEAKEVILTPVGCWAKL